MSNFSIFDDAGGKIFREVTAVDCEVDAVWLRFQSAMEMYRLTLEELPLAGAITAFLLTEILPGAVNPKLSEFQGAFGRAKLLEMNRHRTFRRKLIGTSESFFLDGAPAVSNDDWKNYLRAVYNSTAGFLLIGGEDVNSVVEDAVQLGSFAECLKRLIAHCRSVGVFMEDHRGARSVVFIGRSVAGLIDDAKAARTHESADAVLESVRAYGDRLANSRLIERALQAH
ncbi:MULTISPECIES: hypothetical protein [Variovorax]|uniref:hypothetical protein n=1 Tax=Variovorax TaxID=34072 RepID=UPI003D661046